MGYMRHHAIVLSSWSPEILGAARVKAADLGMAVSPIVPSGLNGISSFLVAPDGSKEGWEESDAGDARRAALIAWLGAEAGKRGYSGVDWAEVQYGDGNGATRIVRHSDEGAHDE
jgi:hypothetical protein